jgi:hypothetical protein
MSLHENVSGNDTKRAWLWDCQKRAKEVLQVRKPEIVPKPDTFGHRRQKLLQNLPAENSFPLKGWNKP